MKYKLWISNYSITQPEIGMPYVCVLYDKYKELSSYIEILVFEKDGWREQRERINTDDVERFRVVLWRSCPDIPDLKKYGIN